jgi:hypothetical protein
VNNVLGLLLMTARSVVQTITFTKLNAHRNVQTELFLLMEIKRVFLAYFVKLVRLLVPHVKRVFLEDF